MSVISFPIPLSIVFFPGFPLAPFPPRFPRHVSIAFLLHCRWQGFLRSLPSCAPHGRFMNSPWLFYEFCVPGPLRKPKNNIVPLPFYELCVPGCPQEADKHCRTPNVLRISYSFCFQVVILSSVQFNWIRFFRITLSISGASAGNTFRRLPEDDFLKHFWAQRGKYHFEVFLGLARKRPSGCLHEFILKHFWVQRNK